MSRLRKKHAEEYVRILNPHPDGATYTNAKQANDHVLAGLAIFATTTCIRFLDESERRANLLHLRRKHSEADHERVTAGLAFEWHAGNSGGCQVMMAERGRSPAP